MVKIYIRWVKEGKLNIDAIPERWREEVRKGVEE